MNNIVWHKHCELRDDVRQGTLTPLEFAADLDAVRTGDAPNVYRLPNLFFDRTYPTYNLKTLVRDVLHQLSGGTGKPVIRVQVAYGGGKTHALIALLHLTEQDNALNTHPTVQEFIGFSGIDSLPQARVALLPFDKFDVIEGLSVLGPDGTRRQVNTPWGALAYQLAGDEGLARVAPHEADYATPAEPILVELLSAPKAAGLSTLVLIDETLMYMRGAVNDDPRRLGTLQDFFQGLTQAVGKVDGAALVASLISHEMVSDDPTGIQCLNALENVFRRVEQTVEPVSREDVAELLRRRLFESVAGKDARRPIVDRVVGAMQRLPLKPSQKDQNAYDRVLESYPFHPDLLEVFYQKWTGLSKFQRTRGVLRTFASALKASEGADTSPFVGPGTLLGTDGELSEAIGELIEACEEGNLWTPILRGELEKAHRIQKQLPRLKHREIEKAVLSTFLHSQPLGQKADVTDLYALLAHAEVDPVSVEKGLEEWREASWFLKEDGSSWCLGTTPNLTSMHVRAMGRLRPEQLDDNLEKRVRDAKLGQNTDGVAVYTLPDSPADIPDTPELHFVIVGPDYTVRPGTDVSASLRAFFDRTYPNSVIVLAPEDSRFAGLQYRIRKIHAWGDIESGDEVNLLSEPQKALLLQRKRDDEIGISDTIRSTYCVAIAVDEDGEVTARQLPTGAEPTFERVKSFLVEEERLLTKSLDPDLLKPDSYLELWRDDETSKPVQRLYGMFASLPRLPRLLNRDVFDETLRRGVVEGKIVLRDVRGDVSQNTFWRESPSDDDLKKKGLEIVPVYHAELHNLRPELLRPGELSTLWRDGITLITVDSIREFFGREDVPKLASDEILFGAIRAAVDAGLLMGRSRSKAYYKEEVPDSEIHDFLELFVPPERVRGSEITQHALPEVWEVNTSSVAKVMAALAKRRGGPIPWVLIVDAVNDGLAKNLFEITAGSPMPPWTVDDAEKIGLQVSRAPLTVRPEDLVGGDATPAWEESGQSTLGLIKETLESRTGVSIPDDVFRIAAQQAINSGIIVSDDPLTNELYQIRVRKPSWARHAEAHLTEAEIQNLSDTVIDLPGIAPELDFKFRIAITAEAEGEPPSKEVLEQINEAFRKVTDKLKFPVESNSES